MTGFVQKVKNAKPFSGVDVIILAVLVVAVTTLAILSLIRPAGDSVEITAPGYSKTFSLDSDQVVEVNGVLVEISGGEVKVVASSCKTKRCVRCGAVNKAGQMIVCSPNAVVVKIVSKQGNGLDVEVG